MRQEEINLDEIIGYDNEGTPVYMIYIYNPSLTKWFLDHPELRIK